MVHMSCFHSECHRRESSRCLLHMSHVKTVFKLILAGLFFSQSNDDSRTLICQGSKNTTTLLPAEMLYLNIVFHLFCIALPHNSIQHRHNLDSFILLLLYYIPNTLIYTIDLLIIISPCLQIKITCKQKNITPMDPNDITKMETPM